MLTKAALLKQLYLWHWLSSALCLVGILLFAITGITLNHAADIEAKPVISQKNALIPAPLRQQLTQIAEQYDGKTAPLPVNIEAWLINTQGIDLHTPQDAEWTVDEVYIALPRAGGDAWARLVLTEGVFEYELTDRGWISLFNDLHKGRHTGAVWSWFIDVFAVLCLIFSLTGLWILKLHAANRPLVWPVVALGVVLPALLIILFVH